MSVYQKNILLEQNSFICTCLNCLNYVDKVLKTLVQVDRPEGTIYASTSHVEKLAYVHIAVILS